MKTVTLVVPCYNEEESIGIFLESAQNFFMENPDYSFQVVLVNDGSADRTLDIAAALMKTYAFLKVVDLSRNFGKEAALSAGLLHSDGDAVIPIDADLQHPLSTVKKMLQLWEEGYEVVLAKRTHRDADRQIQKITAKFFYQVHNIISDIEIPSDVGDFRLMDRRVVDVLNQLPENRRFMKGLFAWAGFRSTTILYDVNERAHGSSKFNTWRLWNFAIEGFTSFSIAPLKVWLYIGGLISSLSILYAVYLVFRSLFWGVDVSGYPSIMVSILFLGGVQLLSIGMLGEYIGRIYIEAKRRPAYVIRDVLDS